MSNATQDTAQAVELVANSHRNTKSIRVRNTLQAMMPDVKHGAAWKTEWLEEQLDLKRTTPQFGFAMSNINRELESMGYHLTTRGKNGSEYWIEELKSALRIGRQKRKNAMEDLRRSVVFLHNTAIRHGSMIDPNELRKIEHEARTNSLRYLFSSRVR